MATLPHVTLHWLEKSRAQRIVWLLELCQNMTYEIKIYKRVDMRAPPELLKLHPLGKSPVISTQWPGVAEPVLIAESALICEYLAEHFAPDLIPIKMTTGDNLNSRQVANDLSIGTNLESKEYMDYKYIMYYSEGSFLLTLQGKLMFKIVLDSPKTPMLLRPLTKVIHKLVMKELYDPEITKHCQLLESFLQDGRQYLCSNKLTAADIMMSFGLISLSITMKGSLAKDYPKHAAYIARIGEEPAYKSSIAKVERESGEPFVPFDEIK